MSWKLQEKSGNSWANIIDGRGNTIVVTDPWGAIDRLMTERSTKTTRTRDGTFAAVEVRAVQNEGTADESYLYPRPDVTEQAGRLYEADRDDAGNKVRIILSSPRRGSLPRLVFHRRQKRAWVPDFTAPEPTAIDPTPRPLILEVEDYVEASLVFDE